MALDLQALLHHAKRHISADQLKALAKAKAPLTGLGGLRRWIAERDFEAFIKLYFPDEFVLDFPPIHREFIANIEEIRSRQVAGQPGLKLARAIPRGHAKTTFFARLLPLWSFLYGWSPLTVILGNNFTAARRLLKNVREVCETNQAIREDFPELGSGVWQDERIEYGNAAIVCFGVGSGAIRGVSKPGSRPSLVIGDDLDDDESVRSAIQVEANIEWFDKSVMALGDNVRFTSSFIIIGTVIRATSLMSHILASPDFSSIIQKGVLAFADDQALWDEWRLWFLAKAAAGEAPKDPQSDEFYQQHKEALLKGAQVLWERPDAYYTLMLYKLARGDAAFNSEIQNDPSATSGKLGRLPVVPLPENHYEYQRLAALDPTIKGGIRNDRSAWVEALFHPIEKRVIFSYCDAQQRAFNDTVDIVLDRLRESTKPGQRRYDAIFCETNSAGTLMADAIQEKSMSEGLFYNIQGVHHSEPKEDRIALLSEYAARNQLAVLEEINPEFLREYNEWPSYKFDDSIDSGATIVRQLKHLGLLDLVPEPF